MKPLLVACMLPLFLFSADAGAQIAARRYVDAQGMEVIVNRDAVRGEEDGKVAAIGAPAAARAAGAPLLAARVMQDPKMRISAGEQDRRDRDRLGILQQELDNEARKYAAAMARAQQKGATPLSAADQQRLTEELYDHQKNIQALNAELRRVRAAP